MTYEEWKRELEHYLKDVSEEEKNKVLQYYQEAFYDRKELGHLEEDILKDFGFPLDAAKKVLSETTTIVENKYETVKVNKEEPKKKNNISSSILLSIVLFVPLIVLLSLIISALAVIVSLTLTIIFNGFAQTIASLLIMINNDVATGIATLGSGVLLIGLSFFIVPLAIYLIKKIIQRTINMLINIKRKVWGE